MDDFAAGREDESQADELSQAIRGRGAFRCFKDTIHRLNIQDRWYAFRDERYRETAREFCRDNGIAFLEA